MPIIVKQQVEPTPQLIADLLKEFTTAASTQEFPWAKGTFLELKEDYVASMGGVPGMPALVMMTGKGSILGLIAMHKPDGEIIVSFISEHVVNGIFAF